MVVVGGAALGCGRSTIGTLVGIFMLQAICNGIVLTGVPGLAYNIGGRDHRVRTALRPVPPDRPRRAEQG